MMRLLAGLFGFIVVVVLAIAAVPFLIPSDWIRERVVAEVEAASGLKLALDGPVSLGLFPSPALEAEDVGLSVGDAPEFARVGEVRFGLALGPLLDRRVDITGLALVSPRVVLAVDDEGRPNWLPVDADGGQGAAGATGPADPATLPFQVSVARLTVEDGTLTYSDDRSGTDEVVTDVTFETALADLSAPIRLTGGFTARGVAQEVDATVSTPLSLIRDGRAGVNLSLRAADAALGAEGMLDTRSPNPFTGRVTVRSDDLGALAAAFDAAAPPVKTLAAEADLTVGGGRVDLTGLSAKLDGTAVAGEIGFGSTGEVPRFDARLTADAIDLDALRARSAGGAGAEPVLDLAPLATFDGGIDLTVGRIGSAAFGDRGAMENLHLVAVAQDGALTMVLDRVRFAGGSLAVRVNARQDEDRVRVEGTVKASGFDVAALAALAGQAPPVSGALGANLGFAAAGRTPSRLLETLDASGELSLAGGTLSGLGLADAFGDPAADRLTSLDVKAAVASLAKPLRVAGDAVFRGEGYRFDATVDPRRLIDGVAFPLAATVQSKRLLADFDGDLDPGVGAANGRFSVRAVSLGAFLATLNRPAEGLPPGELAISGALDASPGSVNVDDGRFTLGGAGFAGSVSVDTRARTKVAARLAGDAVDLGALIGGATGAGAPGAPTAASPGGWSDAPLDLAGLRAFDADVSISARSLRFGRLETGEASVSLALADGALSVTLPEMALYGGTGEGTVTVDAARDAAAVAAAFRLSGVDIGPVLAATVGTGRLGGRSSVSLDVAGSGASAKAIVASLSGDMALEVRDGALYGIDLPALLQNVATAVVSGFGTDRGALTPFERLSATFRIDDGIAVNQDLALASPVVRVAGAGRIDLPAKALAFRVTPTLAAPQGVGADGLSFEVPVVIEGPWEAPRIYPDVAGILENPQAAYARLRELGGLFGKIGAAPEGDLGAVLDGVAPGLGGLLQGGASGRPEGPNPLDLLGEDPFAAIGSGRPDEAQDGGVPAGGSIEDLLGDLAGTGQRPAEGAPEPAFPGAGAPDGGASTEPGQAGSALPDLPGPDPVEPVPGEAAPEPGLPETGEPEGVSAGAEPGGDVAPVQGDPSPGLEPQAPEAGAGEAGVAGDVPVPRPRPGGEEPAGAAVAPDGAGEGGSGHPATGQPGVAGSDEAAEPAPLPDEPGPDPAATAEPSPPSAEPAPGDPAADPGSSADAAGGTLIEAPPATAEPAPGPDAGVVPEAAPEPTPQPRDGEAPEPGSPDCVEVEPGVCAGAAPADPAVDPLQQLIDGAVQGQ